MECGRKCYFRFKFNLDQIIKQLSTEMGGVNDKEYQPGTKEEQDKNREINKQLKREFKEENQIVKLLLLGAGESGKSTIVKQMKLIHPVDGRKEVGFTNEEKGDAQKLIYLNIIDSISKLIDAVHLLKLDGRNELFTIKIHPDSEKCAVDIFYLYADKLLDLEVSLIKGEKILDSAVCPSLDVEQAFTVLWQSKIIQAAYRRRHQFQLNDSTFYFMSSIDRICKKDYEPTEQDVLRSRVKTTGIHKIEFSYREVRFQMYDVGGQRSERKKWIHCFDNVTAILFVISIAEYDQMLEEDNTVSRMTESISLFETIINNDYFKLKPIITFFNKKDLFEEKIRRKGIKQSFPAYNGPVHSFEESTNFIVNEYINKSLTPKSKRSIYTHLTTATDTNLVKSVFQYVMDIVMNMVLDQYGIV